MTAAASTETGQSAKRRPWPALLHRMVRTVRSRALLGKGQHVVVGLSGGPDSVALLALLCRLRSSWKLTVTAVHCNYGLRGKESEGDQAFVTALCRDLQVPLVARRLDVSHRAARRSLQAEARDLRYAVLSDTAKECGAHHIAVGHTADDQAETVLLWMLRGAGLTGLSGMPMAREGSIIRPLLEVTRDQVLDYLKQEGLSYRHDSSNDKLVYRRNQVRHQLLPVLKRMSPSSVEALCRLADLCREDHRYLDAQVTDLFLEHVAEDRQGWTVDRLFVQRLPRAMQRRLLRELLRRCDPLSKAPSARSVDRILQSIGSAKTPLSFSIRGTPVRLTQSAVRFYRPDHQDAPSLSAPDSSVCVLASPSEILWAGTNQTIRVEERERGDAGTQTRGAGRIVVDAARLSRPLIVRSWRPGDRFCPMGMKGSSKKLQDYFTDVKVPAADRDKVPLVIAEEGIVWVVGYRQDERWAVTEQTRRCLILTVRDAARAVGA
jgi:tRNA(Ile)-lysidine synthase